MDTSRPRRFTAPLLGTLLSTLLGACFDPNTIDAPPDGDVDGKGDVIGEGDDCDPLDQDCGEGYGCYFDNGSFACFAEGDVGVDGVCEFLHSCEPGLGCISAAAVPCTGDYCCTPMCEVGSTCDGGRVCSQLQGDVGICTQP